MAERQSTPPERGAREGKEGAWLFLRTLVGLLAVGWLLAALFSPPDPLTFLIILAPLWLLAAVGTWWLVSLGGFERLRESELYRPGYSPSRALALFVLVALVLKLAATTLLSLTSGSHSFVVGVVVSAGSLAVAALLVGSGWLARTTGAAN